MHQLFLWFVWPCWDRFDEWVNRQLNLRKMLRHDVNVSLFLFYSEMSVTLDEWAVLKGQKQPEALFFCSDMSIF